jgi:hypothetical protein
MFCVCLTAEARPKPERPLPPKPLDEKAKHHYESLARSYMPKLWTNDYTTVKAMVFPDSSNEQQPWRQEVGVRFSDGNNVCKFRFFNRKSDKVIYISNLLYDDVPFGPGLNPKPINTTEVGARARAAEIAEMFGVSNLWDNSKFEMRAFGFVRGKWEFQLSAVINGYPSLYPLVIILTDTPGLNLCTWHNLLDDIPSNPPTNVVLTATQARGKAESYLKQYFPMKNIVPKMTFMTNNLEYVTPNYNYIRPADETGFSEYIPPKDSISLAWRNYFKRPTGLSFSSFPVIIDVDAATGEMLGGSD